MHALKRSSEDNTHLLLHKGNFVAHRLQTLALRRDGSCRLCLFGGEFRQKRCRAGLSMLKLLGGGVSVLQLLPQPRSLSLPLLQLLAQAQALLVLGV